MKFSARKVFLLITLAVLVGAGGWAARGHVNFDWNNLAWQLHAVDWRPVAFAFAAIYLSAVFRAWRWRLLMGRSGTGTAAALVPAQFIGFTVVAIFGRVADLARPYLIARRTRTAVATQLAVYSVERAYDLAAAAILFSLALAFAPRDLPHHEYFTRAGVLSLAATLFLAAFALGVRFAAEPLAALARRALRVISPAFADSAANKIADFHEGLLAIATAGQFFGALAWSLVCWVLIASSYYATAHAFRSSPGLVGLTVAGTMLLMATSMGGSLLQLPVLGWFTQIGVLAGALHLFFAVPVEVASACGALLMIVLNLSVVPPGLVFAKLEGVGLRAAAHSGEDIAEAGARA